MHNKTKSQIATGWLTVCLLVFLHVASGANGQLAITEAMSSAATNCGGVNVARGPDFWELTNFGDEAVDLTGYSLWDGDAVVFGPEIQLPGPPIPIQPGESIIFVRSGNSRITNAASFRQWWWGNTEAMPALQIYFYGRPGFDDFGDAVRLWDTQTNLVAEMRFGEAHVNKGITFVPDSAGSGVGPSQIGVCEAFRAASCDDVGSPGRAPCGPIAMSIVEQPRSQTVEVGTDLTLRIRAGGLPRPRGYQWCFNGTPLPASGPLPDDTPLLVNFAGCGLGWRPVPQATDLTIRNVRPEHGGDYFVVFTNGLERMTSTVATVTVNSTSTPPRIDCPADVIWFPTAEGSQQTNLAVSLFQRATFEVFARAYPPPAFQWSWSPNGTSFSDLPGATNRALTVWPVVEGHAGIYRARVTNSLGTAYAHARLTVSPNPELRITEAMAFPCETRRSDWWELTNTGAEPVNLAGYRWNDRPGNIGGGPTITNAVILGPGESVILTEGQTPDAFREWWGLENLPPGLQFIMYTANGLAEDGDEIVLWNHSAIVDADFIDSLGFSVSRQGSTFWFDFDLCAASESGVASTNELCGAFVAANGCDIGSPGWTRWTPPAFSNIRRDESGVVHLEWKAQSGSTNVIHFTSRLAGTATEWKQLGTYSFSSITGTTTDTQAGEAQRFYRITRIALPPCPCPDTNENAINP